MRFDEVVVTVAPLRERGAADRTAKQDLCLGHSWPSAKNLLEVILVV
jgi:hypothetical protein